MPKALTRAEWDEAENRWPKGRYVIYAEGREMKADLIGYCRSRCQSIVCLLAIRKGGPRGMDYFVYCPECTPQDRLELLKEMA
jgi:hypothetical protein